MKTQASRPRSTGRGHPKWVNFLLAATIGFGAGLGQALALPQSATDETKVPHYFGPSPNWANSPLTLPDAQVVITGKGIGATAVATVGGDGAVTGITVTSPGSGYGGDTKVDITGSGTGAKATATVVKKGVVTEIALTSPGSGYTQPDVTITGGGGSGAAATAYGGVDAVTLADPTNGYGGYTMPTVDFDLPNDPNGVRAKGHAVCAPSNLEADCQPATADVTVTVTGVVVDAPGSGYSTAPGVTVRNGTLFDPIPGGDPVRATATLALQAVVVDEFGTNYNSDPTVTITDLGNTGSGAAAVAYTDQGSVIAITLTNGGSGYVTPGGMRKFVDGLPQLCDPSGTVTALPLCTNVVNNLGQYLPIAVPDTTTFPADSSTTPPTPAADYYVIALVQHREQMHSDLPPTLLREYVQLKSVPEDQSCEESGGVLLTTDLLNGSEPTLMPDGSAACGLDQPHFLGPVIIARKDRPVRITFYNLLPNGAGGDLFLPTDSTMMGSGPGPDSNEFKDGGAPVDEGTVMDAVRNPECTESPKAGGNACYKDNRATLHLHGGITPWISDGTPHQWITPAGEVTSYPEGVSVGNVPDMVADAATAAGVPDCSAENDGCQTFYYTNQQSARLMFYHDHAWGITRLNVYAGEAAGYLIQDDTETALVKNGVIPADQIPLVIQDRTFVPSDTQLYNVDANGNLQGTDGYDPTSVASYGQDPTWDASRWGSHGNFWYHHVYMPAQNPGDPGGMSAFGRWMYGPWFWPPATPPHGPIDNPYYTGTCDLNKPDTWTYDQDPFCEPPLIPGTPNISAGMEQFNDTPIVNGTAFPTVTLDPKSYRLRILNAANDRFWNLQWYVADPSTGTDSEVALNPAELALAQTDPVVFPTPVQDAALAGPDWIQIGTEGGFLPAPVVVDGQQFTTWITDPTRFDVGNVDKHSLLLAPAERADVIVDFSKFAGKTLILYNDAPAAFPARVPGYDYYTGGPDLWPAGPPTILPGYGPNTRTIMQVKVSATAPAAAFDLSALQAAFKHHADGSGVFESGQHPIIVGQAAYNTAYGTDFVAGGWCNSPSRPSARCDGFARISEQGGDLFGFNTLLGQTTKTEVKLEPKAIHDEMNATNFDEFGRMQANLGLEAVPATPALQNFIAYPHVNPPTELIDLTNLPKNIPGVDVTPIASGDDGTQIWKITHNGVDTHPIHFHLYDVQLLNRVTWDNIIIPPDASELGWKDTVRVSPLEDTIVALRPIVPELPFELPNSIRPLNPMVPLGSPMGFSNVDAAGIPTDPIVNALVNYGWEYVWHCHILSHEEMDMMRPQVAVLPPNAPDGLAFDPSNGVLTWNDNSINETAFVVQKLAVEGTTWTDEQIVLSPLDAPNIHESRTSNALPYDSMATNSYRVVAQNTAGYTGAGGAFMTLTASSESETLTLAPAAARASVSPSSLAFGNVTIGTDPSPVQDVILTNVGTADLTVNSVSLPLGVFAQNGGCTVGTTLVTDASCTIRVTFTPNAAQYYTENLSIGTSDVALTVPLSGTGVAQASVPVATLSTASLDFVSVNVGATSAPQEVTLTSTGTAPLTVSSITASTGVFAQTNDCLTTSPLAPTATCTISVTFTPSLQQTSATQSYAGSLSIGTNDPVNGTQSVSLTGIGDWLPPAAPTNLTGSATRLAQGAANRNTLDQVSLRWTDGSTNEAGFVIQRAQVNNSCANANFANVGTTGPNVTTFGEQAPRSGNLCYRVAAQNPGGASSWSNVLYVTTP